MKNFDYQTPTRLIFGRDVVAGLPEVMRPFGRRILLTYGEEASNVSACTTA